MSNIALGMALGAATGTGYLPVGGASGGEPPVERVSGVAVWRNRWLCVEHDEYKHAVLFGLLCRRRLRQHLSRLHGVDSPVFKSKPRGFLL